MLSTGFQNSPTALLKLPETTWQARMLHSAVIPSPLLGSDWHHDLVVLLASLIPPYFIFPKKILVHLILNGVCILEDPVEHRSLLSDIDYSQLHWGHLVQVVKTDKTC